MSIQVIARVLPKRWGSPSRKIVALKLADVAREDGTKIYPSIATVAAESELSERQVQRVMDEFRKEGLLITTRKGGGRYKTNEYRFDMTAIECLPDARPMPEGEVISLVRKGDMVSPFANRDPGTKARKGDTLSQKGDTVSPNPSLPLSTSSKGNSASDEAGADTPQEGLEEKKTPFADIPPLPTSKPPSLNKLCWDAAKLILENKEFGCVRGWIERAESRANGLSKLLEILKAARDSGTGLPVGYVNGSLNKEFGPIPQPEKFDGTKWKYIVQSAINKKEWSQALGPAPGKKGCLVPAELITAELTTALAGWRKAA